MFLAFDKIIELMIMMVPVFISIIVVDYKFILEFASHRISRSSPRAIKTLIGHIRSKQIKQTLVPTSTQELDILQSLAK